MTQAATQQSAPPVNDAEKGRWTLVDVHPTAVFELLPQMDRVMIAMRGDTFMHERLGVVDQVTPKGDDVTIKGAEQDITLPIDAIKSVVLDISVEMRGKLYPKLEFLDAEGTRIVGITGLEGVDPFATPLSTLSREAIDPAPVPARSDDPAPEIADDDAGLVLLTQLSEDGTPVQIRAVNGDMQQRWNGVIEKIMPMGGYINVMTSGFHLHLAAGAVARWDADNGVHRAVNSDGAFIGLEVVAP